MYQTTVCYPVKKRNIRRKGCENSVQSENDSSHVDVHVGSAKRALFDSPRAQKKKKLDYEFFPSKEEIGQLSPCKSSIKLFKQNTSPLQNAKRVFHTSLPSRLVERENEIRQISGFLHSHINEKKPGSLYISGAPGTGKTCSVMHVLNHMDTKHNLVFINCMSVNNPSAIYKSIATELNIQKDSYTSKNIANCIEKYVVTSNVMTVLVLDEIDHLDSKGQEVLYSLFELPQLTNSSAILIGIANALDLTDRVLPRLQAFKCEPILLHFQPYGKEQIVAILEDRLSQLQNGSMVIKPNAIQLCARKIASCTGDIRKALDVCRRAIEMVEKQTRQQLVLKSSHDDRCNPGSPSKCMSPAKPVDLPQINAVLHEVYGSRLQVISSTNYGKEKTVTLPLKQAIILCSLILMKKCCKDRFINLGKLYDVCKRICRKRQVECIEESEFHVLCQLLESRGFIELKKNKVPRMTKIHLRIEEGEVEHVLQDKALLAAVLADTSVISPK